MKKYKYIDLILRIIALLGVMGVIGFYVQISQGHLFEFKQWLVSLVFLTLIGLISLIFLRRELTELIHYLDLLVPLCFLITVTEIVRWNFLITTETEALNISLVHGYLVYIPFSNQEFFGLSIILIAKILCTAWVFRLIWQIIDEKKLNLSRGLSKIIKDSCLVLLGMIIGYGVVFIFLISASSAIKNVYLFSVVLSILCLGFNLITAPLIPTLLKYEEKLSNGILQSFSVGWRAWISWFFPIVLQTLVIGISIGFPTNFFQLLSIDSSLLSESRFFWSIKDLWMGGIPNSFQWYPTLTSFINESNSHPFYVILSAVVSVFSVLINLRVVHLLYEINDKRIK